MSVRVAEVFAETETEEQQKLKNDKHGTRVSHAIVPCKCVSDAQHSLLHALFHVLVLQFLLFFSFCFLSRAY